MGINLYGIGRAASRLGSGLMEERRAREERERLTAIGQGIGRVRGGDLEPGTPEFEALAGEAMGSGVSPSAVLGAVPEPPQTRWSSPIEQPGGRFIQVESNTGDIRPVEGLVPLPDEPAPRRGIAVTAADGSVSIVDPTVMGDTGIDARVPGQPEENEGLPTLTQATDHLIGLFAIPDERNPNLIAGFKIPEERIHQLARLWTRGKWTPWTPVPVTQADWDRLEGRAQGVPEPEPRVAPHLTERPMAAESTAVRAEMVPEPTPRVTEAPDTLTPEPAPRTATADTAAAPTTGDRPAINQDQADYLRVRMGWTDEQINERYRVVGR